LKHAHNLGDERHLFFGIGDIFFKHSKGL
jgi:hypothetical protein